MHEPSVDPPTIGPFDVLYKLGEGAMGVVYAGRDRQLDRKVALKLVRRQLLENAAVRTRMVREAQAMARLSSPYVVQVYQVGEHADGIYVAMEYVDGETLGEWLKSGTRTWDVVLRTLCDAGRGLAAAHAAGLVHRDFKPDNVLVDADGRARVLDFGLVHREGGPSDDDLVTAQMPAPTLPNVESVERTDLHWSVRLTRMGNVLGTPAYMSPEQHFGRQAGAASDQFSFCITLYEALYGSRPFGGDTWAAIRTQVQEGTVPPPPLESRVPRRLFKVLARGLAKGPEERWPSMDALLEALERDPWRTRTRVAAMIGLIGAASAASYAVAISQVGRPSCATQPELLAGVWDVGREAAVSRAFTATHMPFASDTWNRVRPRIDGYAQAWLGEWQAACESRTGGVQIGRLAELRSACLARRRARLAALVEVFGAADRAVVENAVQAVAALPSVAACADEEALDLAAAPPDDPEVAAAVEALREKLDRAEALEGTGQYETGVRLTATLRAEAAATGYLPLVAEATLVDGRMLMQIGRSEESAAALMEAVRLGVTQDHHLVAAEAAATRIFVLGELLGRRAEALATEGYVDALVQRARDDGKLIALFLNNIAVVHQNDGTFDAAAAYYERALEVLRKRPGEPDILTAIIFNNLGNMAIELGQFAAAKARHMQAVELFGKLLGENHPLVSHPLSSLGDIGLRTRDPEGAVAYYLRSLALMEVSYGVDHPYLLHVLPGLGQAEALAGHTEKARRYLARAVTIGEAQGIHNTQLAQALQGLAELAVADGAKEQARDLYARAVSLFDEAGGKDMAKGARAALRAGELAVELGDVAGATAWFERVLAKRSGTDGQTETSAGAALRLAVILVERDVARACALASEARGGLPEDDPRRAEAEDLALRTCPKR